MTSLDNITNKTTDVASATGGKSTNSPAMQPGDSRHNEILELIVDGVLVTDLDGQLLDFNQLYVRMWNLPTEVLARRSFFALIDHLKTLFADSAAAQAQFASTFALMSEESFDLLLLADGRIFEQVTKMRVIDGKNAGRVWSVRDVTQRERIVSTSRDETRALELLNKTGTALASNLDVQSILQLVTDAATELTHAQFGAFFFNAYSATGESYTLYTLSGAPREAFEKFPLPRATAMFGPTFRGEGIIRSDDVLAEPRYGQSAPYHGMPAGHLPVRSYLAVPVMSRAGEVHGGLFFGHALTHQFSVRHEQLISTLAAQAAIALDNARLFEASERTRDDLTQRNRRLEDNVAEHSAALNESERQFRTLVANVTDYGIYMLDPQGYVASWNPGAERIKGYSEAEIIGEHFSKFYTEVDRDNQVPQQALATATRTGKYESEAWRVRKDGSLFWASVVIHSIRGDDGHIVGFAKVTRDMTERRAIQEQLNQSQKMEAIGQITGGVAHDFNNLLTVILGNLETLTRRISKDDERLRRAADHATRGAQRAATLTQQLLAFSRRQPLNPKPTDINRLVNAVFELVRRTIGEKISIETLLGEGVWQSEIDPNQLESALLNLSVNARDAMPDGGKITIETTNAHFDDEYAARVSDIALGQYVLISVSDTGHGMSADVMTKAFNPFFTTKPIGQGTGLGLSQVYGYVKQSGGHIKIYSEEGHGTTVKLYLPRLKEGFVEREPAQTPRESLGKADETILVVEDDSDVRAFSLDTLRDLGYSVLEARDAEVALRILQLHPEIQLVFTDVGLPGMNGRELIEKVHALRPLMKVLFTSGYARHAIVHDGRLDAGVELLTKPFTRAQLADHVRRVLDNVVVPEKQGTALVVEDDPTVRMYIAESLSELGFEVVKAETAVTAFTHIEEQARIDLAVIDIGLPDGKGTAIGAELLHQWPFVKVVMISGDPSTFTGSLTRDRQVAFVAKPFDKEELRFALDRLVVKYRS